MFICHFSISYGPCIVPHRTFTWTYNVTSVLLYYVYLGDQIDVDLFLESYDPLYHFDPCNLGTTHFHFFYTSHGVQHFLELQIVNVLPKARKGSRFRGTITNLWSSTSGLTFESSIPHQALSVTYRFLPESKPVHFPRIAFLKVPFRPYN